MSNEILEVKRTDLMKVPFKLLRLADNLREDLGDIDELANSIAENGVKEPLRGYLKDGLYYVVNGKRRFTACQKLLNEQGLSLIVPFIKQAQNITEEQSLIEQLIANEGKPFTPLEQAEGVQRLSNYGWPEKDIAKTLGKSITYISSLLKLSAAPKKAKNLIKKGVVSGTLVIDLMKKNKIDDFINNQENYVNNSAETAEKTPAKKVTSKDINVNSVSIFKQFCKEKPFLTTIDPCKDEAYLFAVDMVNNKMDLEQIKKYFSDGK